MNGFDLDAPVFVAGHRGLAGGALLRALRARGHRALLTRTSTELDLRERDDVFTFFAEARPAHVVLAAARVGGIGANVEHPVEFLSDNLRIQTNVLDAALAHDVDRLLFLGSSCIYPRAATQPIREEALLTGPLEPTNEAYAIAKIAGIHAVRAARHQRGRRWISAMPANLYGPGDNVDPATSHLLPALIRRYDDAVRTGTEVVTNWGTGTPRRELLHVDDLAAACLLLLDGYDDDQHVNVGTGSDATVREIAALVADAVGYEGETRWDPTRPDGTPRKLLDVSRLRALGWAPQVELRDGIRDTVRWFRDARSAGT